MFCRGRKDGRVSMDRGVREEGDAERAFQETGEACAKALGLTGSREAEGLTLSKQDKCCQMRQVNTGQHQAGLPWS